MLIPVAISAALAKRYLSGLLDPDVSGRALQKLMYFMQEAGESLHLSYVLTPTGPCAENLRPVLNAMGGDFSDKPLELEPEAVETARSFLRAHAATRECLDRVSQLVDGFETPFGLELLATVHWIATHDSSVSSMDDLVQRTSAPNTCDQKFTPRQIAIAADVLARKGWIAQLAHA